MDTLARGLRNVVKLIEVKFQNIEVHESSPIIFYYGNSRCLTLSLPQDGTLAELVRNRYKSFDSEFGAQIEVMDHKISFKYISLFYFPFITYRLMDTINIWQAGKVDFETLEKKAFELGEPRVASGKQVISQIHSSHYI